jgi:RNA polymerase sigma-32 factor
MDDSATSFMATASRMPRLDREEELALARRWRDHQDRRAADALVRAHLRDVAFTAYRYRHYEVPVSDLVAEGNLGLLRALDKFDPDRGLRFSTYAAYWIRAYIVAFILRSWSLVRSRSGIVRAKHFFRLRREYSRARSLHGEDACVLDVVAERLGIARDVAEAMIHRLEARDVSLDEASREDGAPLLDSLAGEGDAESTTAAREIQHHVSVALDDALAQLDPRERFIIESRTLAARDEEMSLADIGRHFSVSRERARQLEERAQSKLRQAFVARYGDDFALQHRA